MEYIKNILAFFHNCVKWVLPKVIFQMHYIFSAYYGQESLLMDEERSSMLPMMAAGEVSLRLMTLLFCKYNNIQVQSLGSSVTHYLRQSTFQGLIV